MQKADKRNQLILIAIYDSAKDKKQTKWEKQETKKVSKFCFLPVPNNY